MNKYVYVLYGEISCGLGIDDFQIYTFDCVDAAMYSAEMQNLKEANPDIGYYVVVANDNGGHCE